LWVTPFPSLPRHFRRTEMVFRAVPSSRIPKKPGSSSCELGSPPELVVSASARSLSFPGAFHGVSVPLRDVDLASPLTDERPRLVYVPPTAFRTLSTGCSSLGLADLFRSAATSRISRWGCSPDQAVPPRRWPLPSRRWRRVPIAGCPTTPVRVASTSGPSLQAGIRCAPARC
jgi:hypothetical protein